MGRFSHLVIASGLLLLVIYTSETSAQRCPQGWRTWRSLRRDCYYFSRYLYSWEEGNAICKSHGGTLVTFRRPIEHRLIRATVNRRRRNHYIGFNQVAHKLKTAIWVDGTKWQEWHTKLWAPGEPNNYGGRESCGEMRRDGKFNDIRCTGRRAPYICRRPRTIVEKCDRSKGWTPFGDRCVRLFEGKLDWRAARESCQRNEGDMLVVDTSVKLSIIKESVVCRAPGEVIWLGLSDVDTPGTLQWVDGSNVSIANWFKGEPRMKQKGETCTELIPRASFRWRNNICRQERKYFCSKPQGKCPDGWRMWRNNCYQVNSRADQQKTWIDAHNYCQQQGASLLKVESRAEQLRAVRPIARRLKAGGIKTFYLGISDKDTNGKFLWTDGLEARFKWWRNKNQPRWYPNKWSCGVVITRTRGARWMTRYCFTKRAFVCKMPIHDTHIPPTPAPTRGCYDPGWTNFRDKCYFFSDNSLDWVGAQQECSSKYGANLATIDSPEIQSFISQNLAGSTHVGLNNRGRESSQLLWIANNQPVGKFLNWALWHPILGVPNINCVTVRGRGGRAGTWLMYDCRKKRTFVCEKGATNQIVPASTPPTLPWDDKCGPGWFYDSTTDFCYKVNLNTDNFFGSQEACMRDGGKLASISSKHEQMFIQRIMTSKEVGGAIQFWTGGNNLRQDAGWRWTDDSAFGFFNWNPGMPDSRGGANCIKMETSLNGLWTTDKCDGRYPSICKKATMKMDATVPTITDAPPADCGSGRMVSGEHYIENKAFSASSEYSAVTSASNARIVPNPGKDNTGWQPKYNSQKEWLQVDFSVPVIVKGIIVKGRADSVSYVTKYKLLSLYDSQSNWIWYSETPDGTAKIIPGNTDSNSESTFMLSKPIQARFLRVIPSSWSTSIGLRLEVLGCIRQDCREEAVVSGDARVPDAGLTASSIAGPFNKPIYSRINLPRSSKNGGSWTPAFTDRNPWIQADLGRPMRVRAVLTKGRDNSNEWVTTYQLAFSDDGTTFVDYQEPYGTVKTFTGNTDTGTAVTNYLKSPIVARYIRLSPKASSTHPSLRWEVFACLTDCSPISLLSGDHAVQDWAFKSSTALDSFSSAVRSRIDSVVEGNLKGGWSAAFNDNSQYIQADLGTDIYVVGISTRGRDDREEWVTKYIIGYSHDGSEWYAYYENGERKVFDGNWDRRTVRKNFLYKPFSARYIRLYPQDSFSRISLRWEVHGCPGPLSGIHAGCYTDTNTDPDMSNSPILSPTGGMTSRICINHCFHQGYLFAGILAGDTCHCGNRYGKHGTSVSCTLVCSGNREDKCGGDNANSVYNTGIGPTHRKCPPGWMSFRESCYMISSSRQTFSEAINICSAEGANLVSVEDMNEMDFVTYIAEENEGLWLGLNDRKAARTYEWTDGTPVVFTNWDVGQPSNWASRDASCVYANALNGRWSGEPCGSNLKFLCEKPKEASEMVVTVPAPPGCPRGWTAWNGNCYLVVYNDRTWKQAATNCRTMDSQLVRIMSREEQVYIRSRMVDSDGRFWTDLTDAAQAGTYVWSDESSSIPYTNWGRGQPDKRTGNCVALVSSPSLGLWFDVGCEEKLKSICKRPQAGISTPTMAPTVTGSDTPCPDDWLDITGNCYLVVNKQKGEDRVSWTMARADCRARGGDLASFHSQDDVDAIWRTHIAGATDQFWIGLNTRDPRKGHMWTDMSAVTYTNWAPNEPNNVNNVEDCVEMYRNDGKWNDIRCDVRRNWICKVPKGLPISDLSTTAAPVAGGPGSCSPDGAGWRLYDGRCYFFADGGQVGSQDWRNAERYCARYGGHLVSIHSQTQLNFIKAHILRRNMTATSYWIGLNELDLREGYKWSDKTPVDFINWGPNEPNAAYGNEPCIALRPMRGEWHNMHCADRMGVICSKYKGAAPTTPAPPSPMNGNCPTGFVRLGNKCFKFVDPSVDQRLTFEGARNACIALGANGGYTADLATIDSRQEQAFITAHLMDRKSSMWIGLRQPLSGDYKQFSWITGTPVTFTAWKTGQPDSTVFKDGNCVAVDTATGLHSGKWFDSFCLGKHGHICMAKPQSTIVTPQPTSNPCPRDFMPWRRSCYLLLRGSRSWQDSRQYCSKTATGAQLATISDVYEQNFVYSLMNLDDVGNDIWIGLSDFFSPGVFTWANSWPVTYTMWDTMQPTRPEGGCVSVDSSTGRWKDGVCSQRLPSVCKTTPDSPPTTPSPVVNGVCPPDEGRDKWIRFGRSCFLFVNYKHVSYKQADYECVERNAQLTSVHSQEEHEFIASTANGQGFWIGFHKTARQSFVWRDDSAVDFVRWNSGEPSDRSGNANENCVELWGNGNWNDLNCYNHRNFICRTPFREERSTATIPYKTEPKQKATTKSNFPTLPTKTQSPITRTVPPRTVPPLTLPPPVTRHPTTRPTDSPTGSPATGPSSTAGNGGPGIKPVGVQTSGGEIAAIVILLLLLIALVVGIFMLFRHTKAKQVTSQSGFDNAMYTTSSDSLQLDANTNGSHTKA